MEIPIENCLFGYSALGKKDNLLAIKSSTDPHVGRSYSRHMDRHLVYYTCSCQRYLKVSTVNGRQLVVIMSEKEHTCPEVSWRSLFFKLKKNAMIYGTKNEIKKFEEATASTCEEPGYSKVAQRDWCFSESEKTEKYSVIVVLEKNRRSHGRSYLKDKKGSFYCSGCAKKKTRLIVDHLPSGLYVIWSPMNDIHSSSCKAEETATLTAKHGYKLEDNTDNLDAYEMLPKERWLLGHSNGKRNNMIFIKKSSAETSYYRFHCPSKVPINSKSIPFRCDKNYCGCHSCAYVCIDQEQIVTASVMHKPNCGHRCWNAMIEEQKDYKAQLAAAGVDGQNKAYSEVPCVNRKRVKMSLPTSTSDTDNNSSSAAAIDIPFPDSIGEVHHMTTRSNERCAQKSLVSIQQKITAAAVEVEETAETLINDCSDSDNTIIVCISSDSEDSDKENQDSAVCEMRSSVIRNPTSNELNRHKIFPIFNRVQEQSRETIPEKSKRQFTSTSDKLVTTDPCNSLKKPKLEIIQQNSSAGTHATFPGFKIQQPNHINCSVDLDDFKDVKLSYNSLQFVRPSNVWLNECCKLLDTNSSKSAYKNWAMLRDVDLASTDFPQIEHAKTFKQGFELVSYLLTGSEEGAPAVKEQIGMYFLDHYETMGGVEGLDCSKMTRKDVGSVMFAADMSPIHFKVVSKLFKCTVVLYNYLEKSKFVVKCEDSGAPTIVAGFNEVGYFVFLD